MKIIIAGAGDVGFHLAQLLSYENQSIMLVDSNKEVLEYASSRLDVKTIPGDCAQVEILKDAGVAKSDVVLAVTTSEKTNLVTAILAKKLGAKQTFARTNSPEYLLKEQQDIFKELGIDHLISPIKLAADEILRLLKQSHFTDIYNFEEGRISLIGVSIIDSSPLAHIKLSQLPQDSADFKIRPVIILRDTLTIIPKGNDMLVPGDLVYFILPKESIDSLKKLFDTKEHPIKNVMILGEGEMGYMVARLLEKEYRVTIIEKDRQYSKILAGKLSNAMVVNGDYSNFDILAEEGLDHMDAFVALTNNSETNIISSLTAKNHGVFKTIARVESKEYTYVSQNIGVDSLINKKLFAANDIFRYIRKGKVEALTSLSGVEAEIIEYLVDRPSKLTRKPLKDVRFPPSSLIGAVIRNKDVFIPDGDFQIELNDKVIVLALPKDISKLEKFFK